MQVSEGNETHPCRASHCLAVAVRYLQREDGYSLQVPGAGVDSGVKKRNASALAARGQR